MYGFAFLTSKEVDTLPEAPYVKVSSAEEEFLLEQAIGAAINPDKPSTITLINSAIFLSGFLERNSFPDDNEAAYLQQKHDETWRGGYPRSEHWKWRAKYVGTVRGNLEYRYHQLDSAIKQRIEQARRTAANNI